MLKSSVLFIVILTLTMSVYTVHAQGWRVHIHPLNVHLHIMDKKTVQKISKTAWHIGQLSGAATGTYLLLNNQPAAFHKKLLLLGCLIPSMYTLINCGITGLHDLCIKEKTVPDNFKEKIKEIVRKW